MAHPAPPSDRQRAGWRRRRRAGRGDGGRGRRAVRPHRAAGRPPHLRRTAGGRVTDPEAARRPRGGAGWPAGAGHRRGSARLGRALRSAVTGGALVVGPGLLATARPTPAGTGPVQHGAPRAAPARRSGGLTRQPGVVDAGSFTIFRGEAKVGREEFTIRMAPAPDAGYVVSGTALYADRRIT